MPGFDKSGPMGQGAMSGRGLGMCNTAGDETTAFQAGYGRGMAFRRGFGAARGRGMYSRGFGPNIPVTARDSAEKNVLKAQVNELQQTIQALQQQIENLQQDK